MSQPLLPKQALQRTIRLPRFARAARLAAERQYRWADRTWLRCVRIFGPALLLAVLMPPAASPSSAADSASTPPTYRSAQFGFTWRLPLGWEFVSAAEVAGADSTSAVDIKAARRRGATLPAAVVVVADVVSVVPKKTPETDPTALKGLEEYALTWMKSAGAENVQTSRLRLLGSNAVRVSGVRGIRDKESIDLTLLYRGRRRFELRCLSSRPSTAWPCREAFSAFAVVDQPDRRESCDVPHILHLRDTRSGIQFDAPDDEWMAIGPRTGMNGAHSVWIWNNRGRQIDVSVLDLAAMPAQPDESTFLSGMADHFRRQGMAVLVKKSQLAGRECTHLEASSSGGNQQDFFLQKRGGSVYAVLVTQPVRDPDLLVRARAGFRIAESQENGGAAQPGVAPGGAAPRR